jgi:hypothetical protein
METVMHLGPQKSFFHCKQEIQTIRKIRQESGKHIGIIKLLRALLEEENKAQIGRNEFTHSWG